MKYIYILVYVYLSFYVHIYISGGGYMHLGNHVTHYLRARLASLPLWWSPLVLYTRYPLVRRKKKKKKVL